MKKRILSMLIVMAMIISCIVMPVSAAVTHKDWSNVWFLSEDDTLEVHPVQYSFTIPGDEVNKDAFGATPAYQLLDEETVDGKKNYLIMRTGTIAARSLLANSDTTWYNPESKNSLAYYMDKIWTGEIESDSEYTVRKDSVDAQLLNTKFKDYLIEHEWVIEASTGAGLEQTTITAKAVIPSVSEMDAYSPERLAAFKLLAKGQSSMLTRTPRKITDGKYKGIYIQPYSSGNKPYVSTIDVTDSTTRRAWGMFWISEDFFKNVKVDVDSLGTEVLTAVLNANENSESLLRDIGYTNGELVKMGVIEPPVEPVASEISISVEKAVPGYPVKVDYKYSHKENKEQGDTKIYWYVSDSENGTYEKIQGAEGNEWPIWNVCEGRYIKAKVVPRTIDDIEASEDYFSENAIKIGEGLKAFNPNTEGWSLPTDMPQTSPEEYKFSLQTPSNAGFTYHMLEAETENGEGRFFILQMGSMISNGKMTSVSTNYKFDPSVKYSVAGWLNDVWAESSSPAITDYYNTGGNGPLNGNATAIETNIKPYIVKHTWLNENSGGNVVPNDFTFEAKVALLSTTEFFKHYKKIGKNDYGIAWLRTSTENSGKGQYFLINPSSNVWAKNGGSVSNIHYYRPVYYLSEDFFKDVRLDTEAVGIEAAKMIRNVISKEEMLSGKAKYTEEELVTVFGYPEKTGYVENAVVSGNLSVAETVTAQYDFNKNGLDKDKSDVTRYQWYRTSKKDGELQIIENANGKEYKITEQDLDKFLAVKVTVIDEEGEMCTPAVAMTGIAISAKSNINIQFVSLSELSGASNVTAEFKVTNNSGERELTFIIAVYDTQNEMCALNLQDLEVKSGTDNYSVSLEELDSQKEYKCRVMVLDNQDNMRPLYVGEI